MGGFAVIHLASFIAHRGASPYAPENTMAAFEKAREMGASAIEFDVMMSQDGELFVFHDETLERTTNGSGRFAEMSSDYIKSLDAGSWFSKRFIGEKVPTFTETLLWCAKYGIQPNIEIKPVEGAAEATTTAILAALNRYWPSTSPLPLVSSFSNESLKLCAHLLPDLPLGVLFETWHENWHEIAAEVHAFSIHLHFSAMNEKRIELIKQAGYKLCIYTVNMKEMAQRFIKWGADSILSDYPDLMDS